MLITLANCKTFLGITDNTKDTALTMIINMVSDYIESQTGRTFTSTTYTNEAYDGSGTHQLKLKHYPVSSFTKLEVNNSYDNTGSWETISSDDYWVDLAEGIITKTSGFRDFSEAVEEDEALSEQIFPLGKQKYRATYVAGYTDIPYDIQYACASLSGQILQTRGASGIKSESLGDHSITYSDIAEVSGNSMFNDIINKYRDIPLA